MNRKKVVLPIVVILVACLAAFVVLATAPEIKRGNPEALLPALTAGVDTTLLVILYTSPRRSARIPTDFRPLRTRACDPRTFHT